MEIFSGIQYMRALALIYSHSVPGFQETPAGFDPKQKRNPNPKRKAKTRLSVDRLMSTVDRTQTESSLLSVGRSGGRPFHAKVDRTIDRANPVHVVHTGRPAFSTGRPCGRPGASLAYFNASFCSFVFRSLCYLLSSPLSPLSLHTSVSLMPVSINCGSKCLSQVLLIRWQYGAIG